MLFSSPIQHKDEMEMVCPQNIRLLAPYSSFREALSRESMFSYPVIIPREFLPEDTNYIFIVTALYFREEQYGYILMDYKSESYEIHEILTTQISMTYKRWLMLKEITESERKLRSALDELQAYTHHLQHISERDELTGLYNRRGFLSLAAAALEAANKQQNPSILFFFDLDGLKKINDNNGHEEGDYALMKAASILRNTFRSSDIVGRLGGDEFVVFSPNVAPEYIDTVIERISKKTELTNKGIGKPYKISMSYGWAITEAGTGNNLNLLIQNADELLYKNKNQREKKS